ncbi:hypothetical protein K474DRAFT_1680910 [Panus rudis PR-1116 ss-1]|nr:hypothetical protein K474DRAFT_1680910 [Panus rudis PR-1116 ss-1]
MAEIALNLLVTLGIPLTRKEATAHLKELCRIGLLFGNDQLRLIIETFVLPLVDEVLIKSKSKDPYTFEAHNEPYRIEIQVLGADFRPLIMTDLFNAIAVVVVMVELPRAEIPEDLRELQHFCTDLAVHFSAFLNALLSQEEDIIISMSRRIPTMAGVFWSTAKSIVVGTSLPQNPKSKRNTSMGVRMSALLEILHEEKLPPTDSDNCPGACAEHGPFRVLLDPTKSLYGVVVHIGSCASPKQRRRETRDPAIFKKACPNCQMVLHLARQPYLNCSNQINQLEGENDLDSVTARHARIPERPSPRQY